MWLVSYNLQLLSLPSIDLATLFPLYPELRELSWLPCKLDLQCIHMIQIDMAITHNMHKISRIEITYVRQHMRQQRIARNIERHPEPHIAATLIQLTAQSPSGPRLLLYLLPRLCTWRSWIADIELREHVTRRQRHLRNVRRIPRTQYHPPVERICLELLHDLRQLVNALARIVRLRVHVLGAKVPPLKAVDGAEVANVPV